MICPQGFPQQTPVAQMYKLTFVVPAYFGLVDGKHRVPLRAVLLTCLIVGLLALLNIGQSSFIALGAITSLSSISLYLSYAIVLAVALYKRLTDGLPTGEWTLGRWGLPINIFSLVFTLYSMIWLPFSHRHFRSRLKL